MYPGISVELADLTGLFVDLSWLPTLCSQHWVTLLWVLEKWATSLNPWPQESMQHLWEGTFSFIPAFYLSRSEFTEQIPDLQLFPLFFHKTHFFSLILIFTVHLNICYFHRICKIFTTSFKTLCMHKICNYWLTHPAFEFQSLLS